MYRKNQLFLFRTLFTFLLCFLIWLCIEPRDLQLKGMVFFCLLGRESSDMTELIPLFLIHGMLLFLCNWWSLVYCQMVTIAHFLCWIFFIFLCYYSTKMTQLGFLSLRFVFCSSLHREETYLFANIFIILLSI